jgi:hypothetical protein
LSSAGTPERADDIDLPGNTGCVTRLVLFFARQRAYITGLN